MRYACRKDKYHDAVREALAGLGFLAIDTFRVGGVVPGFPDLLAVRDLEPWPRVYFVEVKSPTGRQTRDQVEFAAMLPRGLYVVVRSVEEVLTLREDG